MDWSRQFPTLRRLAGTLRRLLEPFAAQVRVFVLLPGWLVRTLRASGEGLRLGLTDNPVVVKEMRETFATRRAFVMFAIFTALLAFTVFLAWPRGSQIVQDIDIIARRLFSVVGTTMLVLVALLAPAFSAVAITGEKESGCFDLLVTSGVGEMKILLGKLLGSLIYLGLLVIATAPLVSVCLLLGGIAPSQLVALYVLLFEAALGFALIGLIASCFFERNNASLGVTYAAALPLLGLLLVSGRRGALFEPEFAFGLLLIILFATAVSLALLTLRVRRPSERRPGEDEDEGERYLVVQGLILDRELIPDRWLAPPRRVDFLKDGKNPVFDKELRSEIVGQGTLMLRVIIQIGLVLMIFPFTIVHLLGQPAWYFAYICAFTLLIAPSFACGMFTAELENGTFPLLVTTLLRPSQIVLGKFFVACRLVLALLGIMIAPTIPALIYGHVQYPTKMADVSGTLAGFATCVLWAVSLVALSLLWSMVSRRTTAALVGTYLTGAALFAGPLLAHVILISFTGVPEATAGLSALFSPLGHLFSLTPGSIPNTFIPVSITEGGGHWLRWFAYLAAAVAVSLAALTFMIRAYEWTWRRWRGLGAV